MMKFGYTVIATNKNRVKTVVFKGKWAPKIQEQFFLFLYVTLLLRTIILL